MLFSDEVTIMKITIKSQNGVNYKFVMRKSIVRYEPTIVKKLHFLKVAIVTNLQLWDGNIMTKLQLCETVATTRNICHISHNYEK